MGVRGFFTIAIATRQKRVRRDGYYPRARESQGSHQGCNRRRLAACPMACTPSSTNPGTKVKNPAIGCELISASTPTRHRSRKEKLVMLVAGRCKVLTGSFSAQLAATEDLQTSVFTVCGSCMRGLGCLAESRSRRSSDTVKTIEGLQHA